MPLPSNQKFSTFHQAHAGRDAPGWPKELLWALWTAKVTSVFASSQGQTFQAENPLSLSQSIPSPDQKLHQHEALWVVSSTGFSRRMTWSPITRVYFSSVAFNGNSLPQVRGGAALSSSSITVLQDSSCLEIFLKPGWLNSNKWERTSRASISPLITPCLKQVWPSVWFELWAALKHLFWQMRSVPRLSAVCNGAVNAVLVLNHGMFPAVRTGKETKLTRGCPLTSGWARLVSRVSASSSCLMVTSGCTLCKEKETF